MLHTLALTAAFAAPTVDLPKLFDGELARIGPKTSVPILLPQTMPDEFDEYFPTGFGRERRWGLQLGAAKGCGGATACFIASFSGRKGGKPFGERRVKLARGRVGRFQPPRAAGPAPRPRSSGGSAERPTPSRPRWRPRRPRLRVFKRMANSAIRRGPR